MGVGIYRTDIDGAIKIKAAELRINDQWRICFEWQNGSAHNVEITDYH